MVHVLATSVFGAIAFGAMLLVAGMLRDYAPAIVNALGLGDGAAPRVAARRTVRIRQVARPLPQATAMRRAA